MSGGIVGNVDAERVLSFQNLTVSGDFNAAGGSGPGSLPVHKPPRNLPARQETFAGREAELRDLHAQLSREVAVGITQQAAVHGHGGIGKTSLGVEYGWRHLADYPGGVFFLSCESASPPVADLAPHLGLRSSETAEETARSVKAHLETGAPCLLILDNVPGLEAWRDREWSRHLPAGACRRLVTTRASSLPGVRMYPLQRLSPEDGVALLATYRSDVEARESLVRAVVEWFDGLAVGLTVVGVHLARHPAVSWNGYVKSLEGKGLGMVRLTEEAAGPLPNYEARVDAVFDELLDSLPASERRALEYAGLLPEDQVYAPWLVELLSQDAEVELPVLPGFEGAAGESVVHAVVSSQLLRPRGEEEQVLSLHRVLRRRVRERLAEAGLMGARVDAIAALAERRGEASHAALLDVRLRRELSPLVALSRELTELDRMSAAASLANWVAQPLREMGRYEEARAPLASFAGLDRGEVLSPGLQATLLSNLATILQNLGDLEEARRLMERAIRIGERHFDPDHPTHATSYSNLATILRDLGELGEARRRMERAIQIDERHFDPDHPTLATSYSNLALILKGLGDLEEARRLMERAIEIWERHFDPDHPTLATSYSNLALILRDLGELGEARRRMERAIEIWERHFDPDHPTLATSYSNLALILKDLGDLEEARRLMERAIQIGERYFDPDHPTLATSYSNLAIILQAQGDLEEARRLMERASEAWERNFDADHPTLAISYNNMAHMEAASGNTDRACSLFRRAKHILEKRFTPEHPYVQSVRASIAQVCPDENGLSEA